MATSIRERILEQIRAEFKAVQAGADNFTITWNVVERDAITDTEQQMNNAIGITEGTESNIDEQQTMRKVLEVFTEFWLRPMLGDKKSTEANRALLEVQRVVLANTRLCEDVTDVQLAIDIKEVRNELDLETEDLIGGVVVWNVMYRHDQDDPSKRYGAVP